MDSSCSCSTIEKDLLSRMITFISENEDRIEDVTNPDFWVDFSVSEDNNYTADELRDICNKEILNDSQDDANSPINLLRDLNQAVVFLNWNHCKNYIKSLEYSHIHHIMFSWIASTSEEIENDVLLNMSEIAKRFEDMKDEYDITGIVPDCFKDNCLEMILRKIEEKFKLEKKLTKAFEQVIS